jgi:ABC-type uncharacterized transport system involved in gliding motility auxiliary subunit
MNRIVPYIGPMGLGALVAGVLLRLFSPQRDQVWASFLIAGLLLTIFYVGTRWRELMDLAGRRGARYGANLAILVALVAGIVVAVNYLANRHNKRWDLTAAKQYTLSDQTTKILESLDRDLDIVILDRKDRAQPARELLQEYSYVSDRVSVEVIDQEAEPLRAAAYKTETESTIPLGTIVIDGGDRVERISSATEQELTNAIIKVLKEGKKKIVFLEGHGEKDIEEPGADGASLIKAKLEESNYEVATFHPLESMTEGRIELPDDAHAVIIGGPEQDYLSAEIDALRDYLRGGGKALFLLDPDNQSEKPNLLGLMNELGIELGQNVVIDVSGVGQLFGFGPEVPLVTNYGYHAITERMANLASVYPVVRTVASAESTPEGIVVTELLTTSENSWAEENIDDLSEGIQPDEDEMAGSLPIGVAVTIEAEDTSETEESSASPEEDEDEGSADDENPPKPEGRAVVVGDSDFIVNNLIQAPIGNRDLFLNMVSWVAEDEDLISVRPREAEDRRVFMSEQQQRNIGYLSLLFIPGIILLTGISVWWGRR